MAMAVNESVLILAHSQCSYVQFFVCWKASKYSELGHNNYVDNVDTQALPLLIRKECLLTHVII